MPDATIADLLGTTLASVTRHEVDRSDALTFTTTDGAEYLMHHSQDCCESVSLTDIDGELSDLVGSPILLAEEVSNADAPPLDAGEESYTWTFYRLATAKGYVTLRWYGASNGYYSEGVDFVRTDIRAPGAGEG
jgi:hypothetical protein